MRWQTMQQVANGVKGVGGGGGGDNPHVEVELLPESDVQIPYAAADRCGQRSFNTNQVLLEGIERCVR
jgi:hypothetical protein